jgi:hypothetical protein
MAKLERKMEITLPLPEQKFRRLADLRSGLRCGHNGSAIRNQRCPSLDSATRRARNSLYGADATCDRPRPRKPDSGDSPVVPLDLD